MLSYEDYQVVEARDGVEALTVLEGMDVDLVISDILMPKMDGYRLCAEVRGQARLNHVPFVFHTNTYTSPSDERLALKLGADRFLRRPVSPGHLVETVRELLNAPVPARDAIEQRESLGVTAEYTQRLVEKLEEKNHELHVRTAEARGAGEKLRALKLAAPVAIVSFDAEGIVRTWNRAAERIFGWMAEEVIGRHAGEVGMDLPSEFTGWSEEDLEANRTMALTRRRRDGSEAHLEVSTAPLHDEEGMVAGSMAVFADITERKKAEEALEKAKARMETLSRQLLATGEAELRRIARELHDEIGQGLTAAKIEVEAARRTNDPAALALRLDDAQAVIEQLLHLVRTLSLDLRPASLDELGLVAALRTHVHAQAVRGDLMLQFDTDEIPRSAKPEVEIACFRVAQEAMTNIIRHAQANSVVIALRYNGAEAWLTVQDDGVGFDMAEATAGTDVGTSFGLLSMRERAQLAGGRFYCTSSSGLGTKIEAYFPW